MKNQVTGLFSALVFFLPAAPGDSAGPETKKDRPWLWPASYTEYYRGVIGRNAGVVMGLRLEETDTPVSALTKRPIGAQIGAGNPDLAPLPLQSPPIPWPPARA